VPDELRRRGHPPGGIHGAADDEGVIACRVTRVVGRRQVHPSPLARRAAAMRSAMPCVEPCLLA
jgi:hypothetical protein